MAAGMILFFDALEEYRELTDEQFGRLIRAGLIYGASGDDTELPAPEKYLYPGLRLKISRDQEKYRAVCEKRAEAARKRWNQQQDEETDGMQLHANGCNECQEKQKEKEKEKNKYQYQEKQKAQRGVSAQQYTQRDYTGEQEEAMQRMLTMVGKDGEP